MSLVTINTTSAFHLYTKSNPLSKFQNGSSFYDFPIRKSYLNNLRISATAKKLSDLYNETYDEKVGSLYELLGVSESVTLPEMKKAYKKLALKYHPDVSPPKKTEDFTKKFIQVQEAYETLSDPKTRALYDRDLSSGLHVAFSTRRGFHRDQDYKWRDNWESQLAELFKRSENKASRKRRNRSYYEFE